MRNTSTAHLLLGWDYRQFNTGALMIYSPEGQSIMRVFREAGRYSPDELDIPQLYTPTPDGFGTACGRGSACPIATRFTRARSASSRVSASVVAGSIIAANTGANRQEGGTMSEVWLPQHSSSQQNIATGKQYL
jgi:hypothetical protein